MLMMMNVNLIKKIETMNKLKISIMKIVMVIVAARTHMWCNFYK